MRIVELKGHRWLKFNMYFFPVRTVKSAGPPNSENVPDDGKLKSEVMTKDNRRYYLDLKENTRGRFLRVSHPVCTSQCIYFLH